MATPLASALAGVVFGLALAAPPGPMNAVIAEESVLRGWTAGATAGLGAMTADACFCALTLLGVVGVVERAPTLRGVMVGVGGLLMLYFAYGAARDARAAASFGTGDGLGHDADGDGDRSDGDADRSDADPIDGDGDGDAGRTNGDADRSDGDAGRTDGDAGPTDVDDPAVPDRRSDGGIAVEGRGFRKAFALALTNPYQILFWLTAGVGMLRPGELDVLAWTPYVGDRLAGLLVVTTGSPAMLAGFFAGIALWIVAFPGTLVAVGRRVDRFAAAVAWASALVLAGFGALFLADAAGTLAP